MLCTSRIAWKYLIYLYATSCSSHDGGLIRISQRCWPVHEDQDHMDLKRGLERGIIAGQRGSNTSMVLGRERAYKHASPRELRPRGFS